MVKPRDKNTTIRIYARTIQKVGFVEHCSAETKLLFIYLFAESDASGYFEFDPEELTYYVLTDEESLLLHMKRLSEMGLIEYDEITERGLILNWSEHKFEGRLELGQKRFNSFFRKAVSNKLYTNRAGSKFSLFPSNDFCYQVVMTKNDFSLIHITQK